MGGAFLVEGTVQSGAWQVEGELGSKGVWRWGRGPVGLDRRDETPITVSHVGSFSMWKGLREAALSSPACVAGGLL